MQLDPNNKRHLWGFLIGGGFGAYIIHAALAAVFIAPLPQAPDWCHEWIEAKTGPECVFFKNDFEEAKYLHNKKMQGRNAILLFVVFGTSFLGGGLLFHWIPTWKGGPVAPSGSGALGVVLLLSLGVTLLGPLAYGKVLPPPAEWFPSVFLEIREAQQEAAMKEVIRSLK